MTVLVRLLVQWKPTLGIGWAFAFTAPMILMSPLLLLAFDKPKAYLPHDPPKVAPAMADVHDLLYFDKSRPYWIRLRIRADAKPFTDAWERWLDELFADLDVNGDGYLDAKECERIPPATTVSQMMLNGYPIFGGFPPQSLAQLDENRDGRVSRQELAEYYLRANLPLLRILPAYNPDPYAGTINQSLFELLDTNKDGRLSKEEVRAAEKLLDKLDFDDDECLSALELAPQLFTRPRTRPFNIPAVNQFLLGRPDLPPRGLAQQFLQRYDRDKDYHLDRQEIGLDESAFAALDRDGNGKLDIPELADFFTNGLPDLELALLFRGGSAAAAIERIVSHRPSVSVRALSTSRWEARLGDQVLTLDQPYAALFTPQKNQLRENYRRSITEAFVRAAGEKGFLAPADLEKPVGRQLRGLFPYADRNGDRKLTMQELAAFLDLDFRAADVTLSVSLFSTSRNWFVELDVNHDGRLSRKELQNAWQRLTEGRELPEGLLAATSADDRLNLVFHRGATVYPNINQTYLNPTLLPAPTRGPLWFRKMDRNHDGYVSRREFLGAKADFDKLDRNGDGLIDAEEAEAATKK